MKLHEAIVYVQSRPDEDLWLRPVGWEEAALCLKLNNINVVPCLSLDRYWHPKISDLVGDWEIVLPDHVLDEERKAEQLKRTNLRWWPAK